MQGYARHAPVYGQGSGASAALVAAVRGGGEVGGTKAHAGWTVEDAAAAYADAAGDKGYEEGEDGGSSGQGRAGAGGSAAAAAAKRSCACAAASGAASGRGRHHTGCR